jgi:hypothetical protein
MADAVPMRYCEALKVTFVCCCLQKFLGHFTCEVDAARVYDRTFIQNKGREVAEKEGKLNFPISDYDNDEVAEANPGKEAAVPTSSTRLLTFPHASDL